MEEKEREMGRKERYRRKKIQKSRFNRWYKLV